MTPKKAPAKPPKEASSRRKLLVLDGHSLVYRAFFALPDTLMTSSGQVTNAVYGFTSMLIKLLADERPDGVAVCFDKGRPAFRYERYRVQGHRREQPTPQRAGPLVRECSRRANTDLGGRATRPTTSSPRRPTDPGDGRRDRHRSGAREYPPSAKGECDDDAPRHSATIAPTTQGVIEKTAWRRAVENSSR